MTYIFIRHRRDGKYEVRFNAEQTQDYRLMLLCLRAYFDPTARVYDPTSRTWLVEDKSGKDVDRWRDRMAQEFNSVIEFFCEREEAWKDEITEAYRILHLLPSAPREVVRNAYACLLELCHGSEQAERLNRAFEILRQESKRDDSSERGR